MTDAVPPLQEWVLGYWPHLDNPRWRATHKNGWVPAIQRHPGIWTARLSNSVAMRMTFPPRFWAPILHPTPDRSGEADKTAKQGLAEGPSE